MCRELSNDQSRRGWSDDGPLPHPPGSVVARSARLTVRRFAAGDLDEVVALHNDPQVMHYLNNGRPVPERDVVEDLTAWIDGYGRSDGFGFWAIEETTIGRFAGWIHLRPGDAAGELEPELGYRLRRAVWGRGFATEASLAVVNRGFAELPIERVYACTMAVHRASRRVLEKTGLRAVRTFTTDWPVRIPGDEYGDVEYAMTRAEWVANGATAGHLD